jgi:hypothetical protein
MYQRPTLTKLNETSLVDLLGPVETQYSGACDTCVITGSDVFSDGLFSFVVDASSCVSFDTVLVTITPEAIRGGDECTQTPTSLSFSRQEMDDFSKNGPNRFSHSDFIDANYCGFVTVDVVLVSGSERTQSCSLRVQVDNFNPF